MAVPQVSPVKKLFITQPDEEYSVSGEMAAFLSLASALWVKAEGKSVKEAWVRLWDSEKNACLDYECILIPLAFMNFARAAYIFERDSAASPRASRVPITTARVGKIILNQFSKLFE
jgi:hypothetical protein